jgi:hypothetical protein
VLHVTSEKTERDRVRVASANNDSLGKGRNQSQLLASEAEHLKVAGETSPESYQKSINEKVAEHSDWWNNTYGCKPEYIQPEWRKTRAFCNEIGDLQVKRDAAGKLKEVRGKLEEIQEGGGVGAVASLDPFGDDVSALLVLLGFIEGDLSEDGKKRARALRGLFFAVMIEVIGALGPASISFLLQPRARPEPAPAQSKVPASKGGLRLPLLRRHRSLPVLSPPLAATVPVPPAASAPTVAAAPAVAVPMTKEERLSAEIDRFITERCLVDDPGAWAQSGDLREDWHAWRAEIGLSDFKNWTKCSQELQKRFRYDPNSGRPGFHGIRLKPTTVAATPATPALRLVRGA